MYVDLAKERRKQRWLKVGLVFLTTLLCAGVFCGLYNVLIRKISFVENTMAWVALLVIMPSLKQTFDRWRALSRSKYVLSATHKYGGYKRTVWCYAYLVELNQQFMFKAAWVNRMQLQLAYAQWTTVGNRRHCKRISVDKLERAAHLLGQSGAYFFSGIKRTHTLLAQCERQVRPNRYTYPHLAMAITALEKAKIELIRFDALRIDYSEFDTDLVVDPALLKHHREVLDDTLAYFQYLIQFYHRDSGAYRICRDVFGRKTKPPQAIASSFHR